MIKNFCMVIALLLACGSALAQEQEHKQAPGIGGWLKSLRQKMSRIAPKKVVPVSTGVAGVRGAKQDATVKLYWKGKMSEEAVSEEELREFEKALESIGQEDPSASAKELEMFMKQFPDSALIPDAKKTLDMVRAEPSKSEEKAETKDREEEKQ